VFRLPDEDLGEPDRDRGIDATLVRRADHMAD